MSVSAARITFAAACLLLAAEAARAQEATGPVGPPSVLEPTAGTPASPDEGLLSKFTFTPGLTIPLSDDGVGSDGAGERSASSALASLDVRFTPKENWFASVTFYGYLEDRQEWEPDFSYAVGYDDWRPNTFSLVYSNYTNSRFDPEGGDEVTRPEHGTISAGYKFQLPAAIKTPLETSESDRVMCRVGYNYTPRYETQAGPDRSNKQAATFGCRAPVWKRLFVDATAFAYTTGEQQPWEPDFTYSFGWFDWRPGRFSLQYANYSGNRWFGREAAARTGRFADGAITLTYNHRF
jgi:hypothetical protein